MASKAFQSPLHWVTRWVSECRCTGRHHPSGNEVVLAQCPHLRRITCRIRFIACIRFRRRLIEPALRWNARKQVPVFLPTAQQFTLDMPAANILQSNSSQSTRYPRTPLLLFEERSNLFPDYHLMINTEVKILKIVIIRVSSVWQD